MDEDWTNDGVAKTLAAPRPLGGGTKMGLKKKDPHVRVIVAFALLVIVGCSQQEAYVPPSAPPPLDAGSISTLDGARYVARTNIKGGDYNLSTWMINGNTIVNKFWSTYAPEGRPRTYNINNGQFYVPGVTSFCYSEFETDDCGERGTIANNAIYWTSIANGKVASDQRWAGPPTPRHE